MNVAWKRLGGGYYIADDDFAPVMIHLTDLLLQVKIFVHMPNDYDEWDVTQLTWASTAKLTTACIPATHH
jgi:hypothetical protein